MSVSSEIERIKKAVSQSYRAVELRGVTPDSTKIANLPHWILKIKTQKPEQEKSVTITANGIASVLPDSGKTLSKVIITTNVSSGGGGYTVDFETAPISSVSVTIKYSDDSSETPDDLGGKTYYNVLEITFSDTTASNDYYVRYKMPASGYTEEVLYLTPNATLVLTADATIKEVGK